MTNTQESESGVLESDMGVLLRVVKFLEGVKAVVLLSDAGEIIASALDPGTTDDSIVASIIALLAASERAGSSMGLRSTEMALVKYKSGTVLVLGAGPKAALVVIFDATVDVTQIFAQDWPIINRVKGKISTLV